MKKRGKERQVYYCSLVVSLHRKVTKPLILANKRGVDINYQAPLLLCTRLTTPTRKQVLTEEKEEGKRQNHVAASLWRPSLDHSVPRNAPAVEVVEIDAHRVFRRRSGQLFIARARVPLHPPGPGRARPPRRLDRCPSSEAAMSLAMLVPVPQRAQECEEPE